MSREHITQQSSTTMDAYGFCFHSRSCADDVRRPGSGGSLMLAPSCVCARCALGLLQEGEHSSPLEEGAALSREKVTQQASTPMDTYGFCLHSRSFADNARRPGPGGSLVLAPSCVCARCSLGPLQEGVQASPLEEGAALSRVTPVFLRSAAF